jgi:hypothetical protein
VVAAVAQRVEVGRKEVHERKVVVDEQSIHVIAEVDP